MTTVKSLLIALLFLALAAPLQAKGLNQVQSDKDAEDELMKDDAPKKDAEAKSEEEADEEKPAKEEPPPPPSELSKFLDGRLLLGMGVGLGFGTAVSQSAAAARGFPDIFAQYRLMQFSPQIAMWGGFRYTPMEFNIVTDDYSYRGVAETYNFGGIVKFSVSETVTAFSSFELGYSMVYVDELDRLEHEVDFAKKGLCATVGGGADWTVMPKVQAGPHLSASFGEVRAVVLSGAASFLF